MDLLLLSYVLSSVISCISEVAPEIMYPKEVSRDYLGVYAKACKQLLDNMNQLSDALQLKYRLELLPSEEMWKLRIKVDSVAWFDYWKLHGVTDKDLATKAREYVKTTQDKLDRLPAVDYCQHRLVEPRRYCYKVGCTYRSTCNNGNHSKIGLCGEPIERADGSKPNCTLTIIDEFLITASGKYCESSVFIIA